MPGYTINPSGLEQLAADFKAASRKQRTEYRARLKAAGAIVADDARERIAPHSSKVAESIKVGARGTTGVAITSGTAEMPEAGLLEGDGHPGKFRHPVFARKTETRDQWTWVDQETHPYLWPAFQAKREQVQDEIGKAVTAGLPGEVTRG